MKQINLEQGAIRWDAVPLCFKESSPREACIRFIADKLDDFSLVTEGRDQRFASLGVDGIYVCRASDSLQRMAILEAIQLNNLEPLSRVFRDEALL